MLDKVFGSGTIPYNQSKITGDYFMALLGFNIDLKNVLVTVVILMIVSFGLGYCVGKGGLNGSESPQKKKIPGVD